MFGKVYEKMLKNEVKPERPQTAIWRCVTCWIIKVTRARVRAPPPPRHTQRYATLLVS